MSRSATPCQFPKSLSKSLHSSVVRGMLKQMASGASLGDDGVADVGVHTLAAGRRKMSIISLPCGSGVKNINSNVFKGKTHQSAECCQGGDIHIDQAHTRACMPVPIFCTCSKPKKRTCPLQADASRQHLGSKETHEHTYEIMNMNTWTKTTSKFDSIRFTLNLNP